MVNPEVFSPKAIENIELIHKHICKKRGEISGIDDQELIPRIFERVNSNNGIKDKRKRIVIKASHLFAGIIFEQPFKNGNKGTATALVQYFLNSNGFFLPQNEQKEIDGLEELAVGVSPLHLHEDEYDKAFEMTYNYFITNVEDLR